MHLYKRTIVYRANRRGLPNLPLGVRSTGINRARRHFFECTFQKWFAQLFWCMSGKAHFVLDGKTYELNEGEVFVYFPGEMHNLECVSETFEYCWLTLDHADISAWLSGFGLDKRYSAPGSCPNTLFARLRASLHECTPQGERRAANIAHSILLAASSNMTDPEGDSIASRVRALIDKQFATANWGISDAADTLKIHRTSLLRSFTKHYGLNPSRYLQNRRLQKALSLLRETKLQIQEVAALAGFSDGNYLARAVHRATGMSPRDFRQQ